MVSTEMVLLASAFAVAHRIARDVRIPCQPTLKLHVFNGHHGQLILNAPENRRVIQKPLPKTQTTKPSMPLTLHDLKPCGPVFRGSGFATKNCCSLDVRIVMMQGCVLSALHTVHHFGIGTVHRPEYVSRQGICSMGYGLPYATPAIFRMKLASKKGGEWPRTLCKPTQPQDRLAS